MLKTKLVTIFLILGMTTSVVSIARTGPRERQVQGTAQSMDVGAYINANDILMIVGNTGAFGRNLDHSLGNMDGGLYFPYTSVDDIISGANTSTVLFAGGLWLGGVVNGGTRLALAEYSQEYWPGPMSGNTFIASGDTDNQYRVYKLYADSMASNPNADYLAWPTDQGAPVDRFGEPLLLGDQTLWSVYNDANPVSHTNGSAGTDPLGIEVQQLSWASNEPGQTTAMYMQYKLYNRSPEIINDFYVSLWTDPDLGDPEDDLVGCDSLDNLFYCYNGFGIDFIYGVHPPAVGVKILSGLLTPSPGDSAYFEGKYIQDYANLPMTSFQRYGSGGDVRDPSDAAECYNLLKGLMVNGSPMVNGTVYRSPGDPVTGTGENDSIPGDRRMMGSIGPVDMLPGDSQFVMVKIAVAQGLDRLASLSALRVILNDTLGVPTTVEESVGGAVPDNYILSQNYPNPFNPSTSIGFYLPGRSEVTLDIYNLLGRKVRRLVDGVKSAGEHSEVWDGTDERGNRVATGIYLYKLTAGDFVQTKKMTLIK